MKKFMMATAAIMLMAAVVTTAGCNKDSINGDSDNAGIVLNLRNDSHDELDLLQADSAYHDYNYAYYYHTYDKVVAELYLFEDNNFHVGHSPVGNLGSVEVGITSVGQVSGLSKIKSIPQSNWATSIAAIPGNGYIVKLKARGKTHYARVYVEDWLLSATNNGILGVTIRYEDNWKTE